MQQKILFRTFAENESRMSQKEALQLFGDKKIRTTWNEEEEKWYFSIIDVVSVLTDSADASAYWRKLKERLLKEGNETVTSCHTFKMKAADGKMRQTDVANQEQLFRLIQSIPSPKAEPFSTNLNVKRARKSIAVREVWRPLADGRGLGSLSPQSVKHLGTKKDR